MSTGSRFHESAEDLARPKLHHGLPRLFVATGEFNPPSAVKAFLSPASRSVGAGNAPHCIEQRLAGFIPIQSLLEGCGVFRRGIDVGLDVGKAAFEQPHSFLRRLVGFRVDKPLSRFAKLFDDRAQRVEILMGHTAFTNRSREGFLIFNAAVSSRTSSRAICHIKGVQNDHIFFFVSSSKGVYPAIGAAMNLSEAIREFSQLLALAAAAAGRISNAAATRPSSPQMAELLEEVSQIAERLSQLSGLVKSVHDDAKTVPQSGEASRRSALVH